jgi:hypothetical protein
MNESCLMVKITNTHLLTQFNSEVVQKVTFSCSCTSYFNRAVVYIPTTAQDGGV